MDLQHRHSRSKCTLLVALSTLISTSVSLAQPSGRIRPQGRPGTATSLRTSSLHPLLADRRRIVATPQAVRIPIESSEATASHVQAMIADASGWVDHSASITRTTGGAAEVEARFDRDIVIKRKVSADDVVALRSGERLYSSTLLLRASRGASGEAKVREWRLFLEARSSPIAWDDASRRFATEVIVGLDESDGPNAGHRLDAPITVQFLTRDAPDASVSPVSQRLTQTGTAGYRVAVLACPFHETPVRLIARSAFGAAEFTLPVAARLSSLSVEADTPSILGLGLGTAQFSVRSLAQDGREFAAPEPWSIDIRRSRGISPARVEFDAGRSVARFELRSAGWGVSELSASIAEVRSRPVELRFEFPLLLIAINLICGALGGYFRARTRSSRSSPIGPLAAVAEGAFAAAIVFAAGLIGVHTQILPPMVLRTEAAAGIVGAVCGLAGIGVIHKLFGRVLGARTTETARDSHTEASPG